MMDTSPTGHFAYWTVRLLFGHFAYLALRLRDISPTGHFAYYLGSSPTDCSRLQSIPWVSPASPASPDVFSM